MVESKRVSVEELAFAYRDVKQKLGSVVGLLTQERAVTRERDAQILDLRQALKKAIVKLSLSQSERSRYLQQLNELTEQGSASREELERQHRAELSENASIQASILADLKRDADAMVASKEQAFLELQERLQQEVEQGAACRLRLIQLEQERTELTSWLEASRSELHLHQQALLDSSDEHLAQLAQSQQRLAEVEAELAELSQYHRDELERAQKQQDLLEADLRAAEANAAENAREHSDELVQMQQELARIEAHLAQQAQFHEDQMERAQRQLELLQVDLRTSQTAAAARDREHSDQLAQSLRNAAQLEADLVEQRQSHRDELERAHRLEADLRTAEAAAAAKDREHSAQLAQSQRRAAQLEADLAEQRQSHRDELERAHRLEADLRTLEAASAAKDCEHSALLEQGEQKIAELEAKLTELTRSHQDELLDLKVRLSALEVSKQAGTSPNSLDTDSDSYYKGLESLRKFQAAARERFSSSEERVSSG